MTKQRFAVAITVLTETFRVVLGEAGLEGYWAVLGGLTEDELQRACLRALGECEFMPPPAKLLGYVKAARQANAEVRAADEQIKRLHEWRDRAALGPIQALVKELAEAKTANLDLPPDRAPNAPESLRTRVRAPLVVSDAEKAEALGRMHRALALESVRERDDRLRARRKRWRRV